jgi:hypothetical protein
MIASIDGEKAQEVLNEVKVILGDGRERHITITHEGIVVDLVERGEVVQTLSVAHFEMLDWADGEEGV